MLWTHPESTRRKPRKSDALAIQLPSSSHNPDPVPLLYQTGYLTIVDYDEKLDRYTLAFPNEEVRYAFLESLMPEYVGNAGGGSGKDIYTLTDYLENGNVEGIHKVFLALFAGI